VVSPTIFVAIGLFAFFAYRMQPTRSHEDARPAVAKSDLFSIRVALELFKRDAGRYPTTAEGLDILSVQPPTMVGWKGPYIRLITTDPWGTPWLYKCDAARKYQLQSNGRDGREGGGDDIN
jgi:general secretion pathway protein G